MSNWISSKLKVAETFLQQIDQQAAESLKKNENPRSDLLGSETERKSTELVLPLKDQLNKKKKALERNELTGNVRSQNKLNLISNRSSTSSSSSSNGNNRENKELGASTAIANPSLSPPKPGLTDTDWTELLGVPSQPSSPSVKNSKGVSGNRGLRSDGRRQNLGSISTALEVRKNRKSQNSSLRTSPKSAAAENEVNGASIDQRQSDGEDSRVMVPVQRASVPDLGNGDNYSQGGQFDRKITSRSPTVKNKDGENAIPNGISKITADSEYLRNKDSSAILLPSKDPVKEIPKVVNDGSEIKTAMSIDRSRFRSSTGRIHDPTPSVGKKNLPTLRRDTRSLSDEGSDSDTDSTSSSDSEIEREREERKRRRAQILAEKAAAKAIEAIKERENMVARLEGEKQSLEKILEERAKQQAREASELQNTTMETMEAADVEKQKHNATRMEALSRLAKLETANATLARSLATAQKNHEIAINQAAELRQQLELKEANQEALRRKITATQESGNQLASSKGVELEREILEAEHSFLAEKIERLQEKKKALETNIEMTQKELEHPTEVEVELKRRLSQLTDHLIRKQAQVESLSSEKATILFRIEAVSRSLDESKSMLDPSGRDDIESGNWEFGNSRLRPMFEQRMQSGRKHLGSLVGQLDSVFCAGAAFLRRNSAARIWALVYLACLHIWVMYILFSNSPVADESKSGAVFSLENINNTGGV